MPTIGDVGRSRPGQHLADRRLGQQGVRAASELQQSRGVQVPVGRAEAPGQLPHQLLARRPGTPPSSSPRPAERPPRCAAGPRRTAETMACSEVPQDSPSTKPSRSDSSSHWAARSPTAPRTSAPGRKAATRTCARPNCSRSACSSSPARAVWSCTRISTMPCARAAVSIRDTLDRLVPSTRATSSCDRPSRKYIRAALIKDYSITWCRHRHTSPCQSPS